MTRFPSLLAHCSVDVTSFFLLLSWSWIGRVENRTIPQKRAFWYYFVSLPSKTGSGSKMHHLESVQTKVLYMVTYYQSGLPLKHTYQDSVLFYFLSVSCQTVLELWIRAPYRQQNCCKWKFNDLAKNMTLFYFYLFHLFHSIYPHFKLLVWLLCASCILHTKGILRLPPYFAF